MPVSAFIKILLSFIVVRGPESCPSFVHCLCGGPSSGLYDFQLIFVKESCLFSECLNFALSLLWLKVGSLKEGGCE